METITDSPHRRKSNRKSWIDQSPIDPVTDIAREETLLLTHFTKKPTICFGKVKIGKTLHRKLYVSNPHDYDQCVVIEKFPHEANFAINQKEFVVPGESTLTLNLTWAPENEGGCRQMISFLVDDSYRLQAVLYGTAEVPRQKKVAKRGIMSKSVKKPFSVLHTPNLANLKTYSNSMERETVSETSSVRRALLNSKSKSNQENRQPVTKKSPLVTVKSPPTVQNGNSENQNLSEESENWGDSKSKSAHLETKVRSGVKELYHISRPKDNGTEIVSCVSHEDTTEQVTKTNAPKVNQWKALEKAYQIESMDNVAEMQTFDYALCKKQKQCQKQSVAALYPRRETYLVKKHISQQRRSWKNWNLSPSAQAPIPDRVNVTQPCLSSLTLDADELTKTPSASTVFTSSPNFMTSSPVEKCSLRNKIVQSAESSKRTGLSLSHNDFSACNSRERLDKIEASPKSDDGMSTDSLNSKNSSASSVEALLTGKGDPAPEKVLKTSTAMTFDFRKATPSLPDKLNLQNGRRSTHVVKEPKIVCGQGKLKQKQLFSAGPESPSCHDLSYIRSIDDVKVPPGSHKTQVKKPPTARNSVSSRVRAAQKAVRVTNREQLSQSAHERLSNSQKSTASEKSKSILTRSARSTVSSVKKTEIAKSRKSYLSPKKCGVAQSRLVLGKREKTVIPKHPMPFASKNIYYDERWMQKQEWSFTHWFNFILTPVEDYKLRNCPRVDAGSLVFNCKQDYHLAPSKEVLSFEAYAARRRLNRLRKLACQMFQSADVVRIVRKMEVEIDSQRLVVRKDRPIHADIGLKQNILNWILSYNPLWLRIGLEMVFGEVLLIESNTDILGLSKFIITRLVGNPDIASQFAHPSVPHLYRDGYQTALAKHTLKKFLILVYFLDYAKRHRLIEPDPCLFCKDSEIKASRDFLLNISRDFLSGEGDVTRHLAYLGYVVSYVQTPLDEFDYAVTNLAIDLRNGVRLTRVVEILTGKWGLTKSLRAPAISRLQKIHNVELVLKALSDHGMSLDTEKGEICAKDIVDGHREKSLTLLWRIVTGFQVDILLDVKELEDEIACLNRSLKRKMAIWKSAGVKSTFDLNNRRSSVDLKKFENSKHSLLFDWCQAVCSHYGLKIENFTVSFSDGRVLCYLIHHYYPGLLPLSEIKQETTFTYINECENQQEDSDNSFDLMASSLHCCPRTGKPKIYQELLANEAENFKLIAVKVSQIGGVPTMLRHSDMSNTIPDEKVVITYVTYLAIRLLEIRHESRAAIIIQLAWRKYRLRKKQMLLKLKSKGPTLIPDNDQILQPQSQTPDQSSPKQESISIKNAVIPLSENSDSHNLGHSINDYSPIRPVDREPLAVSSKKGKVLDPILESSAIESYISYRSNSQVVIEPFLVGDENLSLRDDAGVGQKLNKTINLSDSSLIRSDERSAANLKSSSRAGDASLNRPCGDVSAKRLVDDLTDSKGASSQLNTTMDLKDRSPLLRCDLPEVCIDLCNETFNSENCSQRSEARPDLLTVDNSRVGTNQTFDGETCVQKSTPESNIPSVDAEQIQNETFEKICSQRCALNSALRNRKQNIQNKTFETSLPHETDLLNSPVTKVECDDVQGNETFDRELSKPELQNVISGSHGFGVQGNEMTLAFTDSENSSIPDFEDRVGTNGTFEGEVQKRNAKMGTAEFERSHHQTDDFHSEENSQKNESLCEVEEDQCLKRQHSQNKQTSPDDSCRSFVCEETMGQPLVLNQTVEIDSHCQGSFSKGPDAVVAMSFDHDQLNGNSGQQSSEIEEQIFDSYEKDNAINLGLNKTTEYDSEEVEKLQSRAAAELQSCDTLQFEAEDALQSSNGVKLQTKEALESGDGMKLQSDEVAEMQSGHAVDLQSEEALQSGDVAELQSEEALQSGDVAELQSGDVAELQSGDVVELQSEEALQSGDAADMQSGDAADMQSGDAADMQSGEADELWSHEDLFNDSYVCQVHNNSVSFSKIDKTLEIENSCDGSTTLALQSFENGNHVGSCSDVLHTVDSLQNSRSGIVDESKCEDDVISDSQLQQSSFEESEEEWIEEEFILKMSRAQTKEMIVDRESPDPSAKQMDFLANKSALVIQNAFRRYANRKHFLCLRNSTIAIQRWYRYIRKMKKAQQEFQNMKGATLVIQSAVRAHLIRKRFMMQKQCVISLQQRRKGLVLMRNTRTEYLAKRAAIKSIQRWYRAVAEMKTVKTDYENTRNATIKIQRWHRAITEMKLDKTNYENMRMSVLKIQRWHRAITQMRKAKTNYENTRTAAIKIQRWHRAITEMKRAKTDYENTRKAAIKIQRWHQAITEMRKAKNDFENSRKAAIKIQRWHRAITEMKKAKTDYENTREAVIKIQSFVRQRNQQREFLRKKNAFLCIQRWFRSVLRMKKERCKYVSLKKSVIRIQANFRGYKQRKAYLLQQESALKIQSLFRKFLARRHFLRCRNSAITIQQRYRSTMAMRKARKDFESLKAATLVIQSTVKAYQERKRFLQKKKAVLVLQERRRAIVSMRIARTEYLATKGASKLIQRWYRGVKEMQKVRSDFKKTRNAAVKLQSLVRMRNQRKEFLRKKGSTICIQKWYRSVWMMREARIDYNSVRRATIQIQAFFRAHRQRKQFLLKKKSALRIQEWYRSTCRTRQARIGFLCVKSSAIKIQRAYKAYCLMRAARTSYLLVRSSVIKCQSHVRMLLVRQHFLERKRCAIVIQKWYCSRKLMEKEMNAYRSKKLAAVKLQSAFRSYLQRKIYLEERRRIITVQSVVRMWIARCRWLSMKRTAILIQRKYRSRLALRHLRETIMKRHEAATRIQLWFRKQLILRRQRGVLKINCDCCSADSLMKNKKYADIWLDKLQRKLNAVCLLQKYWRAWLCRKHSAIKIQSVVRGWFVRRWLAQQTSAAVLIQSLWRGYKVRCSARHHITDLRKRLEDVTKKATDDKKLSNRFASGFNHLMKYKQISEILQALVNLEVASRLSPVCCAQLAEGNAAPVILTIIRGCNRSVPHIEIIKYCIQILLNLAKYAPTTEAVYDSHPDALDIILNVLMVFREKGLVFAKSCILLAIIALDMHEKGELDDLLTKPQFKEKILSLYKLTSRKYKLEETRVTTRARMMAVKDSAVFREISTTADMAKIGPDWLLGKKILHEIEEPLKAMTYLLNCLGLHHFVMNTQSKLPGKTHK